MSMNTEPGPDELRYIAKDVAEYGAEGPPPEGSGQISMTRRAFLNKLSLALSGLIAAVVGLPVIGFLFAPLLEQTPEVWRLWAPWRSSTWARQ